MSDPSVCLVSPAKWPQELLATKISPKIPRKRLGLAPVSIITVWGLGKVYTLLIINQNMVLNNQCCSRWNAFFFHMASRSVIFSFCRHHVIKNGVSFRSSINSSACHCGTTRPSSSGNIALFSVILHLYENGTNSLLYLMDWKFHLSEH